MRRSDVALHIFDRGAQTKFLYIEYQIHKTTQVNTIHKIAAVVIEDNKFLMVRKKGKEIWTSLGGHLEKGETEERALLREIKEEMGCDATIIRKLGDFESPAAHDEKKIVRLSSYLVELKGPIIFEDPELEEYRFLSKEESLQVKLPSSIKDKVLPYCIKSGLLVW